MTKLYFFPKRYQKEHIISYHIYFQVNTLKGAKKALAVDVLRLTT